MLLSPATLAKPRAMNLFDAEPYEHLRRSFDRLVRESQIRTEESRRYAG